MRGELGEIYTQMLLWETSMLLGAIMRRMDLEGKIFLIFNFQTSIYLYMLD